MVDLQGRILDRPGFERALWGEAELPELPEQAEEPDPETRPPAPLLTQVYVLLWFVGALVGLYFTASLPLTTDNSPGQALAARWFGITGTLSVNDCHDQELADSDGKVTNVALTCLGDFTSDDGTFTASTLAVNAPRWSDAGRGLRASITDASSTLAYVRPDPFLWGLLLFSGVSFSMAALGLAWACSWPIREPIQRRRARRRRERGAVAGPGGERPTPGGP
jgi:hypothetical protein